MYQNKPGKRRHYKTIVIGAGQAGLAAGYHLKRVQEEFLIIDAAPQIGHSWQTRWDSLKLFTPSWADGLPGMSLTGIAGKFPTKDEMAVYLTRYSAKFDLPVELNTKVKQIYKNPYGYVIETAGQKFTCTNVIVATGNYAKPRIPAFADQLDPDIHQIHSSQYRNPNSLPAGTILVVGAATSGLQIALDIAASGRNTFVSGNPPQKVPDIAVKYLARPLFWIMKNVLTTNTKPGRKVEYQIKCEGKAAPLINISLGQVVATGVKHLARLEAIQGGYPLFKNDGSTHRAANEDHCTPLHVDGIVWCTGYNQDLSWIDMDQVTDHHGYPLCRRGVSTQHEGLYFMGMLFQYALASAMVNGVGRDAEYIAAHIHKTLN